MSLRVLRVRIVLVRTGAGRSDVVPSRIELPGESMVACVARRASHASVSWTGNSVLCLLSAREKNGVRQLLWSGEVDSKLDAHSRAILATISAIELTCD